MLLSENNFELNVTEHLQRIPQLKCIVKSQRHSPNLENYYFRSNSLGGRSIHQGFTIMQPCLKKIPYRKAGTCDLHTLPVFSNSMEEKLKSQPFKVEKHLGSQRPQTPGFHPLWRFV